MWIGSGVLDRLGRARSLSGGSAGSGVWIASGSTRFGRLEELVRLRGLGHFWLDRRLDRLGGDNFGELAGDG